jgi:hypothetical protein
MSYDLMVFDPSAAPRDRQEFMAWYHRQAEWSEGHSYDDPSVSTPALQKWFHDMRQYFPAMNGPYRSDADDPHVTDYCIGRCVVYVTFAWSLAEEAHDQMRSLALKHGVGFFDVSAGNGEIFYERGPTGPTN